MSYKYIDVGAYNGDTFLSFMATDKLPAPPEKFDVYLFEPNPKFTPILNLLKDKFDNIKLVSTAAVWVSDGEQDYALDTNDLAYGSTLMQGKTEIWDKFPKVKVKTFDFSDWVKQFKDDYLIVKMDIEGAEFPILEKMLEDDTLRHIDQLWVELHPNKVREYTTTYSDHLIERVKQETEVTLWH